MRRTLKRREGVKGRGTMINYIYLNYDEYSHDTSLAAAVAVGKTCQSKRSSSSYIVCDVYVREYCAAAKPTSKFDLKPPAILLHVFRVSMSFEPL